MPSSPGAAAAKGKPARTTDRPQPDKQITGFTWAEIDQPPTIIRRLPPKYPYRARRRGITGMVVVRFLITTQGTVSSLKIINAEPEGIFENAVLSCVKKWKFRPGVHQGKPVPTWAELPIRFNL